MPGLGQVVGHLHGVETGAQDGVVRGAGYLFAEHEYLRGQGGLTILRPGLRVGIEIVPAL